MDPRPGTTNPNHQTLSSFNDTYTNATARLQSASRTSSAAETHGSEFRAEGSTSLVQGRRRKASSSGSARVQGLGNLMSTVAAEEFMVAARAVAASSSVVIHPRSPRPHTLEPPARSSKSTKAVSFGKPEPPSPSLNLPGVLMWHADPAARSLRPGHVGLHVVKAVMRLGRGCFKGRSTWNTIPVYTTASSYWSYKLAIRENKMGNDSTSLSLGSLARCPKIQHQPEYYLKPPSGILGWRAFWRRQLELF